MESVVVPFELDKGRSQWMFSAKQQLLKSFHFKNKNVEKEKAIEMGQELIGRKFGFGIHKTEEFKYEPDAIYQLGSGLGSSALNQGNLLRGIGNYSGVA